MALVGDAIEYFDHRFRAITVPIADVEDLYDGCRWAEGPVWVSDGGYVVWSDIPNNRMLRRTPEFGVGVFRASANFSKGNARDRQGRLINCEQDGRRVTRTQPDCTITVVAESFGGKRLNSPNDVVVKSDGTICFADPTYGIMSDYERHKSAQEQDSCCVFCADPASGEIRVAN